MSIDDDAVQRPKKTPSIFGRLAHLSRLRDPDTGEYEPDRGKFTSRQLRSEHEETFAGWLACSMQEKRNDLERYLAELGHDWFIILSTWRRLRAYRLYVPASADPAEEALYLCDLEVQNQWPACP